MFALSTIALMLLGAAVASLFLQGLGVWAVRQHLKLTRERARPAEAAQPAVSLLKPLKGSEDELAKNLASFFEQTYRGPFEVVFAASDEDDAGLELARTVAARYPDVPCQFVVSDPAFGLNPKVANLQGALRAARHDLVLQSDANVRIEPDYLSTTVGDFIAEDASLLSSLVVGDGEQSFGSVLENLQLTAFTAPAVCVSLHVGKVACVIGKAMMFRRTELEALGGLEVVRDVLAEDYVLGRIYQRAGKKVALASSAVTNINVTSTWLRFFQRHRRWLQMRAVLHVPGFVADLGANSISLAVLGFLGSGLNPNYLPIVVTLAVIKIGLDSWYIRQLRRRPMSLPHLLCIPLKDVLVALAWFQATYRRKVDWRGTQLYIGSGSKLQPATDASALPVPLPTPTPVGRVPRR